MDRKERFGTSPPRVAMAVLLASVPVGVEAQETFTLQDDRVAVYNLAGNVEIVRGSGPGVVVRVDRRGADGNQLRVAVDRVRGREALRIVYPSDRIVYRPDGRGFNGRSTRRVRDDGTFGDGGSRSGRRVEIRSDGGGLEAWADLRVEIPAGRDVAVYTAVGEADVDGVDGRLLVDTGSGRVVVRDVRGFLRVDTGSGSVSAVDVRGELEIDTGSGGVRIESVTGPRVFVDTGSGSVRGADISTPSLRVDTGSGSIELERVSSPDVYLDTGSGSVEVELLQDVESLDVDTGSGSVTAWLPETTGALVEIDTGSGSIDLEFPLEVRTMRRDHVEGRIGDGRGRIRIDTGSGGVRLRRR